MTLTDFLLARIAEDEAAANAAIDPERPGTHWRWFNTVDDTPSVPSDEFLGREYMTDPASLRTVEQFPTASGFGNLPAFALSHVEELRSGPALHIARHDPARVLAECEAKRRIVEFHKSWPVLVEKPAQFESAQSGGADSHVFRMSQEIAWLTTREYVARFGEDPPTAPMLRALAAIYADHPDYDEEWRP